MSPIKYLIDTSAVVRVFQNLSVAAQWESTIEEGVVAVCPLTELEFLYSSRSLADRLDNIEILKVSYNWVPMWDGAYERAAQVQQKLTENGTHRSAGAVDLVVAATAERSRLKLLHYDADFEAVASVTGQKTEWVADKGSVP